MIELIRDYSYSVISIIIFLLLITFVKNDILVFSLFLSVYIFYFYSIKKDWLDFSDGLEVRFFTHLIYTFTIVIYGASLIDEVINVSNEQGYLIEIMFIIFIVYLPILIVGKKDIALYPLQRTILYVMTFLLISFVLLYNTPESNIYINYFWLIPLVDFMLVLIYRNLILKFEMIDKSIR